MEKETGNQQVTNFELGWLAGVLDGEGHISMRSSTFKNDIHYSVGFGFTNTSEKLLNKVDMICTKLGVNLHWQRKLRKNKCLQGWDLTTRKIINCKRILTPLLPLLTSKKEKAELVLLFCNRRLNFAKQRKDDGTGIRFPYTKEDLWYFDEFKRIRTKLVTPTTISSESKVQENLKYGTDQIGLVI